METRGDLWGPMVTLGPGTTSSHIQVFPRMSICSIYLCCGHGATKLGERGTSIPVSMTDGDQHLSKQNYFLCHRE